MLLFEYSYFGKMTYHPEVNRYAPKSFNLIIVVETPHS